MRRSLTPGCGHCKNLAPEYEEAATTLKAEGIKLAKIDCTDGDAQSVCQEYGVQGYPTLKIFRASAEPADYNGPRKADGIVSYMRKQNLPAVSDITADTHDDFITSDEVVVVAYGDAKHPIPAAFDEFANSARDDYLFGKFDGKLPELPVKVSAPAIVLFKKFDEGHSVFPGDVAKADFAEIGRFVQAESLPLVDEIGPENFQKYQKTGVPLGFFFVDPEDVKGREALLKEAESLLKEHRGVINFVWIDGAKFAEYGKAMGIKEAPGFVIQDLQAQAKYLLPEPLNIRSLSKFVRAVSSGEIKPTIKSEPIPESQDKPVYKLVTDDWENVFGDEDKDVFVEFYAPWCGHCQRLAPVWDTLGEKYANTNVVIAQMDSTENDMPEAAPFAVEGFPTIKFRAAGQTEFIDYDGDRSLESLVEFVEKNSKSAPSEKRDVEAEAEDEDEDEDAHAHDEL